jgi:hypothetical protein
MKLFVLWFGWKQLLCFSTNLSVWHEDFYVGYTFFLPGFLYYAVRYREKFCVLLHCRERASARFLG